MLSAFAARQRLVFGQRAAGQEAAVLARSGPEGVRVHVRPCTALIMAARAALGLVSGVGERTAALIKALAVLATNA